MANTACLNKLQQKYTPPACGRWEETGDDRRAADDAPDLCEYRMGAAGWRGCASICLLQHYIKNEHPELGARVGMLADGDLVMRFSPGVGADDSERLRAACEAVGLLQDARDDIRRLVAAGEMRIEGMKWWNE